MEQPFGGKEDRCAWPCYVSGGCGTQCLVGYIRDLAVGGCLDWRQTSESPYHRSS